MSKRLNTVDSLVLGDQVVIYRGNCTDFRAIPFDVFVQEITDRIQIPDSNNPVVQRFNPNADFTMYVENHSEGTYLLLNPSISITNGTVVLPDAANVVDRQEILFSSTQQINNLFFNSAGASVVGAPNAIAATSFFKLKFDKVSATWYRVG